MGDRVLAKIISAMKVLCLLPLLLAVASPKAVRSGSFSGYDYYGSGSFPVYGRRSLDRHGSGSFSGYDYYGSGPFSGYDYYGSGSFSGYDYYGSGSGSFSVYGRRSQDRQDSGLFSGYDYYGSGSFSGYDYFGSGSFSGY